MMQKQSAKTLATLSRRVRVAELYLQGHRFSPDIARNIGGVHRSTITRDLQIIRKQWAIEMVTKFDEALREEICKIDRVEREAWSAWERSKTFREKTKTSRGNKRSGEETSAQIEKENLLGDPRYLERVGWCIDRRCKLLGLDAPEKHQISMGGELHVVERIVTDRREIPDQPPEQA
jgi:hypothetical protein